MEARVKAARLASALAPRARLRLASAFGRGGWVLACSAGARTGARRCARRSVPPCRVHTAPRRRARAADAVEAAHGHRLPPQ
eukprot:2104300-Pleurochrysis_carterae.AAC.3